MREGWGRDFLLQHCVQTTVAQDATAGSPGRQPALTATSRSVADSARGRSQQLCAALTTTTTTVRQSVQERTLPLGGCPEKKGSLKHNHSHVQQDAHCPTSSAVPPPSSCCPWTSLSVAVTVRRWRFWQSPWTSPGTTCSGGGEKKSHKCSDATDTLISVALPPFTLI